MAESKIVSNSSKTDHLEDQKANYKGIEKPKTTEGSLPGNTGGNPNATPFAGTSGANSPPKAIKESN